MAEVARKTWIRDLWAYFTASQARSMSLSLHRARPQTVEPVISPAMARTASKSPTEAIGKPASMISTPRAASTRATSSFSLRFMLAPGDCSPSRRVVSKIRTRFGSKAGTEGSGAVLMAGLFLSRVGATHNIHLHKMVFWWVAPTPIKNPEIHRSRRVSGLRCLAGRHGPDEP